MKYRKKPIEVEAHQWFKNGDHPEDGSVLLQSPDDIYFLSEGKVVRRYRLPTYMKYSEHSGPVMVDVNTCNKCGVIFHEHGWIDTLEGGHIVCPSDYIIKGVEGEYYPCKEAIFHKTYEAVNE